MNCPLVRNRILALEKPGAITGAEAADEPAGLPEELSAHVAGCADCRSWRKKYLLVEKALTSLPVPESDGLGKIALLEKIRAAKPKKANPLTPTSAPLLPTFTSPMSVASSASPSTRQSSTNHKPLPLKLEDELPKRKGKSFGHLAARFWPAGMVAATLLVGTIAWLSLRGDKTPAVGPAPVDPMLDNLVKLNVELAGTEKPNERLPILAKIADEVNREMRDIARADATGENMQALQEMYGKVVSGLVGQAKLIDRTDKSQLDLLGQVADTLAQAGHKAEQMAAESPQHSAERLREAAVVAREGTKRIRLIKEGRT